MKREAAEYIKDRRDSMHSLGRGSEVTKYSEVKHPNMVTSEKGRDTLVSGEGTVFRQQRLTRKEPGCLHYFKVIDDLVLRPIFIYKYSRIRKQPVMTFGDMLDEYKVIQEELIKIDEEEEEMIKEEEKSQRGDSQAGSFNKTRAKGNSARVRGGFKESENQASASKESSNKATVKTQRSGLVDHYLGVKSRHMEN